MAEQPDIRPGTQPGSKRYHAGSDRSRVKLRELGFDPIEKLVEDYNKVCELIAIEEALRDGHRIRLNAKGKEMTWYPDFLMKLLDNKQKISADLLRYKYGRVAETTNVNVKKPLPFVVQTTKEGETYHAVGVDSEEPEDEDEE